MEPRPSRQVLYSWATPSDPVKFYFIYLIIFIISVWLEVNMWRSENNFLVGLCFHLLRILGTESWSPAFRVKIFTCWVLIDPPLKGYGRSCSYSWGFAAPFWRQPCSSVSCGSILRWPCTHIQATVDLDQIGASSLSTQWLWPVSTLVWMD